jgi:hypothetical protein
MPLCGCAAHPKAERGTLYSAPRSALPLGWITSSWLSSWLPFLLLSSLPFAYSPCRLDIDAATLKLAANEGIVLMKFSVKKNRSFCEIFFASEDTSLRLRLRKTLREASLRHAISPLSEALHVTCSTRIVYSASMEGRSHAQ